MPSISSIIDHHDGSPSFVGLSLTSTQEAPCKLQPRSIPRNRQWFGRLASDLMETNLCNSQIDELIVPGPNRQTPLGSAGAMEVLQSSQVNDSTRAIPPVHRIASEILSEIFLSLTPPPLEMDNDDCPPLIPKTEAPLLLCQICSYWREVAIGLPWLWTRIHVHANTKREMLDTWLARAKTLPLSLSLRGKNESDPLTKFMDLLLPRVSQCQAIHYVSYPAQPIVSLFQPPPASMTYLESINILVSAASSEIVYTSSYNGLDTIFELCPRLRYVRLKSDGDEYMFELSTLRLPWSQLVVLSLEDIHCDLDTTSLFQQLTGLEELSIRIYEWEAGVAKVPSKPYPIFPKLFRLTLIWHIYDMPTPQLHNFITVPKLTDFTLRYVGNMNDFDVPGFDKMRTRSGFALEKLSIKYVFLENESEVAIFFRPMPSIWSLKIESDATDIWPMLSISDGKEILLPRLRELRYSDRKLPEDLVEMVESRWWPGDRDERLEEGVVLQRLGYIRLEIRPRDIIESSLVKRLSKCKDEGLDIEYIEAGLRIL